MNNKELVKFFEKNKITWMLISFVNKLRALYIEDCYKENIKPFTWEECHLWYRGVLTKSKIGKQNAFTDDINEMLYDFFFEADWKYDKLKTDALKSFIDEINLKELSDKLLNEEIKAINFDKENWLDTNSKISKIYNENEKLALKKEIIKQSEAEALEKDSDYQDVYSEYKAIAEKLDAAYEKAVSDVKWLDKIKEINSAIKENKSLIFDFLEFENEKWNLNKIKIVTSTWEELVAHVNVYLWKPIKEEK